jgi:hypothetical protein
MMIDLETLDTRPSTVILSIGAVAFSLEDEETFSFYKRLTWQGQFDAGRTVSEATLRWWLSQSDAARTSLIDGEQVSLRAGLTSLREWFRHSDAERVWAKGPSFDISILEHAYAGETPWRFYNARCVRTISDLVPRDFGDGIPKGEAHNALDDAMAQALFVRKALRFLRKA